MANNGKAKLTEGPINRTLVRLTLQMLIGILAMVAFNLANTYFVGKLGTKELAAISFTFPVVLVVSSLALGLGVGASAVISTAIGEGNHRRVQRLTTDSLLLAVLVVAFFVTIGLFTIDFVFGLMGATPDVLPLVRQYMAIWYLGAVFVVVPMVGNNAIRATGDTKTPSMIMLVAVGVNIALDPLLIFGLGPIPAMGLAGAATATVIGRATTLLVSFYVLYRREKMITLVRPHLPDLLANWQRILFIGLPAAGTNIIVPVSTGVITGMVAAYGPAAVAALGVASRVEMFAMTVVMALASVLVPFVGQNVGAGNINRTTAGIRAGLRFGLLWGALMAVLLGLAARPIGAIFNDDPAVVSNVARYLWLVPASYALLNVLSLSAAILNVLRRPFHAAGLSALRMIVLYIPLAVAGANFFGLPGIFGAAGVANLLSGAAAWLVLNRSLAQEKAAHPAAVEAASLSEGLL